MTSLTYTFLVEQLFGNIFVALIGTSALFILIGILGRMGSFLLITILISYIITQSIVIGGMGMYIILLVFVFAYFVIQYQKFVN